VTCREFTSFIADYLAGELPEPARGTFSRHLERCENCRRYLTSYEETVKLGQRAFDDESGPLPADIPDDLVRAVLSARDRSKP
jgi:anti-sigma factor RsiW